MGDLQITTAFAPVDWHIHEMLFGYMPAVLTGFLLTAIPNWAGRLPVRGVPLLTLLLVVAGRVAVTTSAFVGWLPAAAVDVSFLLLVMTAAAREVTAGRRLRNLKSCCWSDYSPAPMLPFTSRSTSPATPTTARALRIRLR